MNWKAIGITPTHTHTIQRRAGPTHSPPSAPTEANPGDVLSSFGAATGKDACPGLSGEGETR